MSAEQIDRSSSVFSVRQQSDRFLVVVERTIRLRKAIEVVGRDYLEEFEGREIDARDRAIEEAKLHSDYGFTRTCIEHDAISATLMEVDVDRDS